MTLNSRNWHSDNLDTSHFTDAGSTHCRHGVLAAICRTCYLEPIAPSEMACCTGDDPREDRGAAVGLVMLAAVFALGVVAGLLAGGIGR